MFNKRSAYQKRDAVCRRIGYFSYDAYLRSPLWSTIRLRVLNRDMFLCRCCGNRATQVHHNRYEVKVLKGESVEGLRSLCDKCHHRIEFEGNEKRSLTAAATKCRELTKAGDVVHKQMKKYLKKKQNSLKKKQKTPYFRVKR